MTERPDGLCVREVTDTRVIGHEIVCLETADSTNRELLGRARAGAKEGLVVIADQQTAGRGRLDRSWESPPMANLYLSVLLRPKADNPCLTLLPIAAGIAVCEVLREQTGVFALVKWPNDVIVDEMKISGILAETLSLDGGLAVALGIGINVNTRRSDFSEEIRPHATSLRIATGQVFDRSQIARMLLRRLDEWHKRVVECRPDRIVARWTELSSTLGHKVVAHTPGGPVRGKAVRLGRDGALVVRTEDGEVRVTVGDVKKVVRGN